MLKINSKKKGSKSTKTPKPQVAVKKEAPKPEWNSTQSDMDRYKLSRAELVQRKVALMSKHQFEAKELWLKRQEKLKKGIVDEETQSVMDTCLSTKRQPEKNRKNLTYFIKDDNYDTREYSEDIPHEDESEQQLSLLDLQHEIEFKEKPRPQPKKAQETQKSSHKAENEDAGAGGDFIKKVNQSLKDARDLIGKIERYPSITKSDDPEKALSALQQQNRQKENKPRTSSIPKQRAKATPATKEPLRQSQNSQLGASTNSDRRVDIFDSKSDLAQRRAAEEPQKAVKFDEPENEEHEDISQYFKSLKSLNQIEDTIKFLEDNIIGHKDTKTEEIAKNKFREEREFETNKTNKNKRESFSPVRKPASPKKKVEYSPQLVSEDRDYLKSRDNFGLSDIKPSKPEKDHDEHDQSHEKELTHEDEQISFDLTMRSEHPEMIEHNKPNFSYDADDFGGDHHNDISATLKRPYPTPYQESPSVSFPQVIFENKTLKDKSHYEPATYKGAPTQSYAKKNFQSQAPAPAAEEEEDDDLNIERIKGLLQATKNEIEKMNTYQVDAYNSSYKTAYDDIEKENKSKNIESQFQGSFGAKSSGFVPEKIYKSEVQTQPKKSFEPVWEPQRRVLGDISNTHDDFDDDIPAPEPLNVKKYQASYQPASYQPSNNDDSLSIRSFRRK